MMKNNHMTKNTETAVCKNCGSLFERRTKIATGKKYTKTGIRGKGYVTCSKECSREWSRLMCKSGVRQKKEEEWRERLEKLNKKGIINR
ncbi:MAG: hypothetical protein ACOC56_05370 [Atribacterota bacterium]